jgi:hypothetical protein
VGELGEDGIEAVEAEARDIAGITEGEANEILETYRREKFTPDAEAWSINCLRESLRCAW